MRVLALLLLISACSDGEDPPVPPHEEVACDQVWMNNGYTTCEGACVDSSTALNAMGPSCAGTASNAPVNCQKTFEYTGIQGCCISSSPRVLFAECN